MACSKLFSGDLPEISTYIIQNLRNNFNTLYSLALVNRFWCRLAIPLLWEDPFSIKCNENLTSYFLDTFFLFLNDNDKSKVNKIKPFKFDSNLQTPLFNYPSLIKTLSFSRLEVHVTNWLRPTPTSYSIARYHLPLIYPQYEQIGAIYVGKEKLKVIYIALLKIFIENNASLNNLYMKCDYNSKFTWFKFDDITDMILDNPKFISKIKRFSFEYCSRSCYSGWTNSEPVQKILSSLSLLFTSIKHIEISCYNRGCREFEKNLAN